MWHSFLLRQASLKLSLYTHLSLRILQVTGVAISVRGGNMEVVVTVIIFVIVILAT